MKRDREALRGLEDDNVAILVEIINDVETSAAVKIQAVQTLQKIIDAMKLELSEKEEPAIKSVLEAMRGGVTS